MDILSMWRKLSARPAGKWLFSRLVCVKAPYFASIAPRLLVLEPGRGVARIHHRRRVHNHIGSVHAIALCNLAEFVGGLTCDVTIPRDMRWIPKSMQVEYLAKAIGPMTATARPLAEARMATGGYALPFEVVIVNATGETVFRAVIDMWISPKQGRKPR